MPRAFALRLCLFACVAAANACASSAGGDVEAGRDAQAAIDGGRIFADAAARDAGSLDAPSTASDGAPPADAAPASDATSADAPAQGGMDAGSTDTSTTPNSEAACDTQVVAAWQAGPISVGLASPSSAQSYDAVILSLMHDYSVPGGAVAVVKNGQLVFAKGYGLADTRSPALVHPDNLFRIASLSKQITSAAVLVLVQQGRLSLDDHPFSILSALQPLPGQTANAALANITIRNLLQHSGGWNRDVEGDPMFEPGTIAQAAGIPSPPECDTIIRYMLSRPTTYTPGSTYDYSNFGYCVLGAVIEQIVGSPYESWAKANVLGPLGVTDMALGRTLAAERADGEVTYYDYPGAPMAASVFPTGPQQVPWPYGGFYVGAMAAHGAWIASPVDLLRFQAGLDGRSNPASPLLSTTSLSSMTANPNLPWGTTSGGTTPASASYWYGLGWLVNTAGNWWHTGSLPGTATEQVHAANGFGWAAFFNTRPENADAFFNRLDGDLWTAFNGTTTWATVDYFDQYSPAFTGWMSRAAYQATFDQQAQLGNYPSRVEGALMMGQPMFRARFAPFHGTEFYSNHGLDCLGYRSASMQRAAQGFAVVSLQSFVDASGLRSYQVTWAR